jgi:hypothetical protein
MWPGVHTEQLTLLGCVEFVSVVSVAQLVKQLGDEDPPPACLTVSALPLKPHSMWAFRNW